jgi:hypothetical protein
VIGNRSIRSLMLEFDMSLLIALFDLIGSDATGGRKGSIQYVGGGRERGDYVERRFDGELHALHEFMHGAATRRFDAGSAPATASGACRSTQGKPRGIA